MKKNKIKEEMQGLKMRPGEKEFKEFLLKVFDRIKFYDKSVEEEVRKAVVEETLARYCEMYDIAKSGNSLLRFFGLGNQRFEGERVPWLNSAKEKKAFEKADKYIDEKEKQGSVKFIYSVQCGGAHCG